MSLLTIDTAANLCAACVHDADTGAERGRCVRDIGKGHAEELIPVVAEAMRAGDVTYADIDRIAVAVGPGSFTGIRVGVAAARGLALALGRPVVGLGTLEAIAAEARSEAAGRPVLALVPSGHDFAGALYAPTGEEMASPRIMTNEDAARLARSHGAMLAGSGAMTVAAELGGDAMIARDALGATADIATFARLALRTGRPDVLPKPLYVRKPDARPQAGFALPRKGA